MHIYKPMCIKLLHTYLLILLNCYSLAVLFYVMCVCHIFHKILLLLLLVSKLINNIYDSLAYLLTYQRKVPKLLYILRV